MFIFFSFLKYFFRAKYGGGHGVHSPFMYNFVRLVLEEKYNYFACLKINQIRKGLLFNKQTIKVKDSGAGSRVFKSDMREIGEIVRYSAVNNKNGELLFRMVNYFKPKHILELGTSLGIGTMYLAAPNSQAKVITVEACPETAQFALKNFNFNKFTNIELINNTFESALPGLVHNFKPIDFVYIDGNHTGEAMLQYFETLFPTLHNESVLVFDDIHWSKSMESAWNTICSDKRTVVTVDLFNFGIVFFRKSLSKQHYIMRF